MTNPLPSAVQSASHSVHGKGIGAEGRPQAPDSRHGDDPALPSRLTVYNNAPAETVPPKHWTDLPQADRDRHLAARPRLRFLIWAGLSLGGALFLFILAALNPDSARTVARSQLTGGVLFICGLIALYHAWRATP